MKLHTLVWSALAAISMPAIAAVTAEEAKQLGTTLTEFGAIKAGNKEGTIPAYTGGLTKAPAGYKADSGFWVDPYKDEKPLFRIDAKNAAQYADKLSEGQKMLMKKHPTTYYIDVYPSHRSAAFPDKILKATVRNATTCKALKENLAIDPACRGGLPFPMPKNGYEVMWNLQLAYAGEMGTTTEMSKSWVVDSGGKVTMTAEQSTVQEKPYYQVSTADRDPNMYSRAFSVTRGPSRRAGEASGLLDYLDPTEKPRRAWSYTPGQRRVKLAPEFAYDTPVSSQGGVTLFDELFLFSGKMDRFDFKLVGKKEMYIPYNGYKYYFECTETDQFKAAHVNPDCERHELHRVWVVEATLKPGQRHVYSKRIYYVDEDAPNAGMFDAFDQSGTLYRSSFISFVQLYDVTVPYAVKNSVYDFNKGMYALLNDSLSKGYQIPKTMRSEREQNAEAVVARSSAR
jgi:hypothetical protein